MVDRNMPDLILRAEEHAWAEEEGFVAIWVSSGAVKIGSHKRGYV
jgi:hypothetical protein